MITKTITLSTTDLNTASNILYSVNSPAPALPSNYPVGLTPLIILESKLVIDAAYTDVVYVNTPPTTSTKTLRSVYFPQGIFIDQTSGCTLEYRIISSVDDETAFINTAGSIHMGVQMLTATKLQGVLSQSYRFLLKKTAGTATSGIIVHFINYKLHHQEVV
jgi:hypothetical protein